MKKWSNEKRCSKWANMVYDMVERNNTKEKRG